ncbi:MAG: alpha/beta hydrolase, partial [Candidatus Omnitrophica bacterium]|nr:alpha/beta hydrolase [Candidatus Omnitrophota bacterium]
MPRFRFIYFVIILPIILFLTGCSFIPIEKASEYTKNLYKRIQYKTEGNYKVLNIFYATTRQTAGGAVTADSFLSSMGKDLTYGTLDAKVGPGLAIGTMLPEAIKQNDLITIKGVTRTDEAAFLKQISEAVALSPHNSLMVMVFGFKDSFEVAAIKAAYFSYLLDINTPVLLFDWPGNQPPSIPGYAKAQSYATGSGPQLGELLTKIIRDVKPAKIWLTAHSMGCQVVCDAFDTMSKYPDLSDPDAEIDHVILAAPDVAQNEFDEKFKAELASMSRKLTAYLSSDDQALLVSSIINQDSRLGLIEPRKTP